MGKTSSSSSSSFSSNSNSHAAFSTASSLEHHPTDLRLGLSISPTPNLHSCISSGEPSDKRTLGSRGSHEAEVNGRRLFVKVYMEGIPIGRKLDLLAQDGYHELIKTLEHMFDTTITLGSEMEEVLHQPERWHVLTYEDEEGDLIMVGDIPWEMFLSTVRRLRITRVDAIGC
ncbi:hypothetical protein K1719_024972 [Acacia pycnantha]|nr:hypothetical protein K1719_024972 [Acacia pycnantha]